MKDAYDNEEDYAERVALLSQEQRTRLASRLDALVNDDRFTAAKGRLVACVTRREQLEPDGEELRHFSRELLPGYMVPQLFQVVADFPRLPNGKVDRRALTAHDWDIVAERDFQDAEYVAPRTESEQILSSIWAQTLGMSEVSVHDNFYEVGGDSLISIRILARANKAGLNIAPDDFFAFPTIAEQAALSIDSAPSIVAEGNISGEVGLLPIQYWFFDRIHNQPMHWNQSILFQVDESLQFRFLEQTLRDLLTRHDVLRSRFIHSEGEWHQFVTRDELEPPLSFLDCSNLTGEEIDAALDTEAGNLNCSLALDQAPLFRVLFSETATGQRNRLVIVFHHLIVDGESWRIFLDDLQVRWGELTQGLAQTPTTRGTSIQLWASRLREFAETEELSGELEYWQGVFEAGTTQLPRDFAADESVNTHASAQSVSAVLSESETEALLRITPGRFKAEVSEVLLAALSLALTRWTGVPALLIDVEGHGREVLFEDLDISGTMGWFTTVFPVLLRAPEAGSIVARLLEVKETLRHLPRRGIGYGVLRELSGASAGTALLKAAPKPELCFNYLGQSNMPQSTDSRIVLEQHNFGPVRAAEGPRPYLFDVNVVVVDSQLRLDWIYSDKLHYRDTVETLVKSLIQAISDLATIDVSTVPDPRDFPLANLDQSEMDKIANLLADDDDV